MVVIAKTFRTNLTHTFGLLAALWMATLLGQGCSLSAAKSTQSPAVSTEMAELA